MPYTMLDHIAAVGMACGIVGAILVSSPSRDMRRRGFAVWIIGNAAWVAFSCAIDSPWMLIMFAFYWATAAYGYWSNRK